MFEQEGRISPKVCQRLGNNLGSEEIARRSDRGRSGIPSDHLRGIIVELPGVAVEESPVAEPFILFVAGTMAKVDGAALSMLGEDQADDREQAQQAGNRAQHGIRRSLFLRKYLDQVQVSF